MHYFLSVLFFASVHAGAATPLDLSDVSILFPLPKVNQWEQLPKPATEAKKGLLLPQSYYQQIPSLVGVPTNEMLYDDLRVIGLRIDPCFFEGQGPVQCKQQIRMVMQPLEAVGDVTSTRDSSLHLFYELTPEEFKQLLQQIIQLKSQKSTVSERSPLTINPFIKNEGLDGQYFKDLMNIVYQYVGEKNLSRITFMQLMMNQMVWDFGGFDIKNGEMTSITIPRVNTKIQRFMNHAIKPAPVWFFGGIMPKPKQDENLNILVTDSSALGSQNESEIISATRAAFRFENPKIHNPGTVDCVSCHVAQPVRRWTVRQYPWLDLNKAMASETYTSNQNLNNFSPMQVHTNIIRAFGYFMNQPFVAQRTINESAEVLKYIETNF
ncbi:MAG: hypothetical protein A2622_04055 [Bdellovibrionales bacterium RIFCSPHIGHO2_01_FULL_40_29]|nr:MAG: hypothetical protein A2622_04055 [Bdellovibrionales bacterium RIFCSPHIGHO2_01_FULL_40_29]OFZ34888.1 MAG: hypothetical protein A3D17_11320 [Bdellovibrionales bacterium RIFCSPHIGHO2_02_FULL_40_15]